MKKIVLKMDLHDERIKKKAMKTASGLRGVESISADVKDMKLILLGDNIDPVSAVCKLRKWCPCTELVSVGPANVEKENVVPATVSFPHKLYEPCPCYYQMTPPQYCQNYCICHLDENPSGCVIC